MAGDNSQQIEDWNGVLGQRWAEEQVALDRLTAPFGEAALKAAHVRPGERVLDVGCGCGDTALALAAGVGPHGMVMGVDISRPMLAVAQRRAMGMSQLSFSEADASSAALPDELDLLFSRFGVMFFDKPAAAFGHMRRSMKDTGRLAFACWRAPRENGWAMTPVMAARQAVGITPPPADPHAPGPFAFADADRVRAILTEAGWRDVKAEAFNAPVYLGSSPRSAAEGAGRMGPLSRFIRDVGEDHRPKIIDVVEVSFREHAAADGSVALPGSVWVVTANAG